MVEEKKKFLEETNALLKQIGSSERVEVEKKDAVDIGKSINNFISSFGKTAEEEKKEELKKTNTNSFIYYKNQRELNLYKENLNRTDIDILKAAFTFQFSKIKRLLLKKKLLLQNIHIIDNRINNKNVSYTKIIHGFGYYIDLFMQGIGQIASTFTYALFFYILTFIMITIETQF
jgi:hypothetical protein